MRSVGICSHSPER